MVGNARSKQTDSSLVPVKLSDLKKGDIIIADNRFSCMGKGGEKEVKICPKCGKLYVECTSRFGHHLEGEVTPNGILEGFYKREKEGDN